MNPLTMHVMRQRPARQETSEPSSEMADQDPGVACFAFQSLGVTRKAFVMPTVLGGLLPANYRFVIPLAAGWRYTDLRLNPMPLAFRPPPSHKEALTGLSLGLAPFAITLPLHTKIQGMKQFGGLSKTLGDGWLHLCTHLPASVGARLRSYPIQFVLGRATAQCSASLIGSLAHHEYLARATGAQLVRRSKRECEAEGRKPMDPFVGTVALSLFSIPAALSTPAAVKMMSKVLSPTQQTGVTVLTLIGAALGTAAAALAEPECEDSTGPAGEAHSKSDAWDMEASP